MWFEHLVPAPQELPDAPMRLGDCVRTYQSGAVRIDVHVRAGKGWRKINALCFEVGDEDVDPGTIAGWVKASAEHHAVLADAPGKYRAMVWRYFGGELERRKAAFDVTLPCPAPPPPSPRPQRRSERPRTRERSPRDLRRSVLETRLMLEEIMALGEPLPFAPRRDPRATALDRVMRELAGMAERFDAALTGGTVDDIDRTDFQIRWDVTLLRAQEDGDLWTAIAPTIDARLDELRRDALARRRAAADGASPSSAVTSPAGASTAAHAAERTEGAPPSAGDAPSAGKVPGALMPAFEW